MAERLWRVQPRVVFSSLTSQTWVPSSPTDEPWNRVARYLYWDVLATVTAGLVSPSPTAISSTTGVGKTYTARSVGTQQYQVGIAPSGSDPGYFA